MWRQSVWSSAISASLASAHLNTGGFLALTGAAAAAEPTPGMIGYGVAKAAVHQVSLFQILFNYLNIIIIY